MLQYSYIFNIVAHFDSFANFIESSRPVGGATNLEVRKAFNNNRTARHATPSRERQQKQRNGDKARGRWHHYDQVTGALAAAVLGTCLLTNHRYLQVMYNYCVQPYSQGERGGRLKTTLSLGMHTTTYCRHCTWKLAK